VAVDDDETLQIMAQQAGEAIADSDSIGKEPAFLFPRELFPPLPRTFIDSGSRNDWRLGRPTTAAKERNMDGTIIGLVAVIMSLGIPLGAMYTYFRVKKLRTEERLAALARGVNVPMEPELSQAARSRRAGILLVSAAIGYVITFALIARVEPDAWVAASFGAIPFTVGLGFFLDSSLVRRDLKASA